MNRLRIAALCLIAFAGAPTASYGAQLVCQPYDLAIESLASEGWTVMPDIVLPDGYQADRLIIGAFEGFAFAMPVVDGCVILGGAISLGRIEDTGTPA